MSIMLKDDSAYKSLTLTYSPEYIKYRVNKKVGHVDSKSYNAEFSLLQNLRNHFTFILQQKFKVYPSAIFDFLKVDNPAFFENNDIALFNNQLFETSNLNNVITEFDCSAGLLFNPNLLLCDFPENVNGGVSYYCVDDETGIISECDGEMGSDCPSESQLAIKLNCTVEYFHNTLKEKIKKDFKADISKLGCGNPDICLNPNGNGNIMFQCQNSRKSFKTNTLLSTYRQSN